MFKKTVLHLSLSAALLFALVAVPAFAQPAELPHHTESYAWSSGLVNGNAADVAPRFATAELIFVPEAQWLRVNFRRAFLGEESYLELTSLLDGATQRLDARTLREWNYSSAFFNGDAVEVKLFVGANDRGVFAKVADVMVGEWPVATKSICGTDNRVASSEPRVGRIVPVGCTGWIVNNGRYVTAGHCLDGTTAQTLEFNVPLSQSNGTIVHPGPQHQYAIIQSSRQFVNGGIGNDWGIFAVSNNSQTGLQPIAAQGASFTVAQDLGPANIRITGFGTDSGTANQTNQTHIGPNTGSSGTTMRYATDTQGGNSGSPVIDGNTSRAVGVHTHGGCTSSGGNNNGTSTFNTAFWTALGVGGGGVPATPASLTVFWEYCRGLNTMEWSAVTGATYYELYGSTSSSFSWQYLEASTSGTFDAVNVSTTTYFRVRACNASGCSGYRVGNQPAKYFSGCF